MIKTLRWIFIFSAITLTGCKTDFDLTSDWKDITVVYGLLNYTDTAQYIKINKAYLDDQTNALQLAQIEDSNYYNSIDVKLEEYNSSGALANTITLQRVDGNLEGYPKPTGTFISSPNWLYKTKQPLNPANTYRLVVNKDDGNSTSSETNLVNDIQVLKPFLQQEIQLLPNEGAFYSVSWKNAKNAVFYGLSIRFWYTEYPTTNPSDSVQKFFDWQIFNDYVPSINTVGNTNEYKVYGAGFYEEMARKIPVDPNVTRIARGFDFNYAAGGQELYTYYLVSQSQNGITSGQISADYTNVTDGKGILSSRLFKKALAAPSLPKPNTIDSIACNSLTHDLRFLNSQGMLCP